MTTTPILALDELASGQAVPEVIVNGNTRWLELFSAGGRVLDRDDTAPPGSPADGDAYLVAATATGAWAGHDGEIALYISTAWEFREPVEGMSLYVADENVRIDYDGAAWNVVGGSSALTLASTVTQSGTPVANSVGFLGTPQIADQDTYTLALADAGGHYYHVSGTPHTLTIPANSSVAFPIGTVIAIVNEDGAGDITLAITSDTLRWTDQTGTRTIAENGTATLVKVTSTVWRLTGDGIT